VLVQLERLAAEQPVLESATVAVRGAVQVHEHIGHDDLTGVVQRLAQVFLAVRLLRLLVGGDGVDLRFVSHVSPQDV
jgi:hypothetical protein